MWGTVVFVAVAFGEPTTTSEPFTVAPVAITRPARVLERPEGPPWREHLLERARALGLAVRGGEAAGPDRTVEARLVLASEARLGRLEHGQWTVELWWQLVDRRQDEVLWEDGTRGAGPSARAALEQSLDVAVRDAGFRTALSRAASVRSTRAEAALKVQVCNAAAALAESVVTVGRGPNAGVGVVISPDGFVWTTADALPPPLEPIAVRTSHGVVVGRWVTANADLGLALLRIPLGPQVGCAPLASSLPIVRDLAAAYTAHRTMTEVRVLGFLLRRQPVRIMVEPGAHAAIFDTTGALLGFRVDGRSDVLLHEVLSAMMGLRWSSRGGVDVLPPGGFLERAVPLFQAPPSR
ncbi:MAG: hypothetical protein KTR31_37025 [Myxococcales bacterium]|nr:hypothetical protein [Myxococcales bacterium]